MELDGGSFLFRVLIVSRWSAYLQRTCALSITYMLDNVFHTFKCSVLQIIPYNCVQMFRSFSGIRNLGILKKPNLLYFDFPNALCSVLTELTIRI
jgi:hypothetical protein